jgi:hypothetical protein
MPLDNGRPRIPGPDSLGKRPLPERKSWIPFNGRPPFEKEKPKRWSIGDILTSRSSPAKKLEKPQHFLKREEKSFWDSYGSAKREKILEKVRDDKLFSLTGIGKEERVDYFKKVFKLDTGFGNKQQLKKEYKELRKKAFGGGSSDKEIKEAKKRLKLIEKTFGKQ